MSNLQERLRQDTKNKITLDKTCKNLFIKAARHTKYPNLVLFKYKNITVNFRNPCTRQARGIIMDENNDWNIVSYPYDKFFNYGEKNAATIDWNNIKIYEKLDGCLMILYYYDNSWQVSSSGRPDANGKTNIQEMSLAEAFWEVWNYLGYNLPTNTDLCYIFELLSDKQPVKIKYPNNDLYLHGARNIKTLQELEPIPIAITNNWKPIPEHILEPNPNIISFFVNSRSGINYEGLIVCDSKFNRLKIKSRDYIAMTNSINSNNTRPEEAKERLYQLLVSNNNNDLSELCNAFPTLLPLCEEVRELIDKTTKEIQEIYDNIKHLEERKDFAEAVKNNKYAGLLFLLRSGKVNSALECLTKISYSQLTNKK